MESYTLIAVPAALREARRAAREFAVTHGASDNVVADIELAASEACANAIRHSGSPCVDLDFMCEDGELCVRVVDCGRGLDAAWGLDPGAGLGLPIIASLAQRVELRHRSEGGTDVSMAFALGG